MAYQPDDDRFYDSLTGAGRDYQKYRDRVAEDQARTTREIGQMYGQALPNTIGAAMKGADRSQKRAEDQQRMEQNAAQEERAGTKFGWEGQDRTAQMAAAQRQAEYDSAPATEEEAAMAGLKYQPGMTHGSLKQAATIQGMGKDMRDMHIKEAEEGGKNTRSAAELGSAERRSADMLAGENARAAASQSGENARLERKIAADSALEGLKLTKKEVKPAPAEMISQLGESESAQSALENLAAEWKAKASGQGSSIKQFIPNTDANKYEDAANVNAQVIGKFLEGGKMTDSDVPRYKAMLPTPADTPERAQEKLERLSGMIAQKKQAHVDALRGAGYSVGDMPESKGHKFSLTKKNPAGNGVAYGGDANADMSPDDLQAAMVNQANAGKIKPLHKMTIEEKRAELKRRGINADD